MTVLPALYDRLVGGTLGNWFSIVGVLSLMYWAWRIVAAVQAHRSARRLLSASSAPSLPVVPAPAVTMAPGQRAGASAPAEHIAAIAAAVHAMLGPHRIVHIEADGVARAWVMEGRWMQQTSHQPR